MSEIKNTRPEQPNSTSVWYSFCSAHQNYQPSCGRCNAGQWIDEADPYVQIRHWLWQKSPKLWREWANRTDSDDGAAIEDHFPRLEPKNKARVELKAIYERLELDKLSSVFSRHRAAYHYLSISCTCGWRAVLLPRKQCEEEYAKHLAKVICSYMVEKNDTRVDIHE